MLQYQEVANKLDVTDLPNAASVAIIRADQVLLIKRAYAPYRHLWTLPGGRLDPGESIEQCAMREVYEEVALAIHSLHHILTRSPGKEEIYQLAVFATRDFSGQIRVSNEIADYQWIDADALKALRTTSGLHDVIKRTFAILAHG